MTNQEYKDYFIQRGAYPDFEIVSSPMFDIDVVVNGIKKSRALQVGSMSTNNFINIMNKPNDKWYIFNNTGTVKPFNFSMSYVRCCNVPSPNRLNKYRLDKIKKIKNN